MTILIPIKDFLFDPAHTLDASTLPPGEVIRRVKETLPADIAETATVTVESGIVTISLPDPQPTDQQRAAKLINDGIDFGSQGKFKKSISLFEQSLALVPTNSIARRNLAQAQLESGMTKEAEDNLIHVLALVPTDVDALILLGNIFAKKKDDTTAQRMYERAVQIKPDNVVALTNLAGIRGLHAEFEQAEKLFRQAIVTDPLYPNSYYGLAFLCSQQGRIEMALVALNDMFATANSDAVRSGVLYAHARKLFSELNAKAAEKSLEMVNAFLRERQQQIEAASEFPVELIADEKIQIETSITRMAWRHHLTRHEIRYKKNISLLELPHVIAFGLEHIQLEVDVRAAGRNMTFRSTIGAMEKAQQSAGEFFDYLRHAGIAGEKANVLMMKLVEGLCSQLYNIPLSMFIETRLQQFDVLRASQFVSLEKQNQDNLLALTTSGAAKSAPKKIYFAGIAMNAAFAIFTDELYGGKTNYSELYKKSDAWSTAVRLHEVWKKSVAEYSAGDEFLVVNEFAKIVGLGGWYELVHDDETESNGGVDNAELLKLKQPATVMYMVGAIGRLSKMTKEQIKELGFEIALLGQHGIDYTNADSRYSLRNLPGEKFSGLQLMCIMYACWQVINPALSVGMDFSKEYAMAKQIVEGGGGE